MKRIQAKYEKILVTVHDLSYVEPYKSFLFAKRNVKFTYSKIQRSRREFLFTMRY